MEAGQPGSAAPRKVIERAHKALDEDLLGYTTAIGITSLRDEISRHYEHKYNIKVEADRVIITTGSSGAFVMAFLACFEPGSCGEHLHEVLLTGHTSS